MSLGGNPIPVQAAVGPCNSVKAPVELPKYEATAALNAGSGPLKNANKQTSRKDGCAEIAFPRSPPRVADLPLAIALSRYEVLTMKYRILLAATAIVMLSSPLAAHAQGIPDGITHGAYVGNNTAGPIGAFVGGAVGGIVGGFEGALGIGSQQAAYQVEPSPPVYHRTHVRHSYHHVHRHYDDRG